MDIDLVHALILKLLSHKLLLLVEISLSNPLIIWSLLPASYLVKNNHDVIQRIFKSSGSIKHLLQVSPYMLSRQSVSLCDQGKQILWLCLLLLGLGCRLLW